MLVQTLLKIKEDLLKIPKSNKTLEKCIKNRLAISEDTFKESKESVVNYILSRDNKKVIKTLAREAKKNKRDGV